MIDFLLIATPVFAMALIVAVYAWAGLLDTWYR